MKKVLFFVAVIATVSLTSCDKEKDCTCTTTTTGSIVAVPATTTTLSTKEDCSSLNTTSTIPATELTEAITTKMVCK